jgi:hypothetical protein
VFLRAKDPVSTESPGVERGGWSMGAAIIGYLSGK